MIFCRITIILGSLFFLLLSGGCSSLEKSGVAPSATASASVEKAQKTGNNQTLVLPGAEGQHQAAISGLSARSYPTPGKSNPANQIRTTQPDSNSPDSDLGQEEAITDLWQRLRNNFSLSDLEQNQQRLKYFEKWYSRHPKYFERLTERAYWFLPYILNEVEKRGMPGEIALLPAIESAFRPDAVSRSQAVGLWQFIAGTGRRYGLRQDWWIEGRRDLVQSTRAALDYLDYLEKEFDGDWELALASYNAGEGNIRRQVKYNRKHNKSANYSSLKLRRETAEYVPKLFALRNIISEPQKFGITLTTIPNRHTLVAIDARSQTDLTVAAALIDVSASQLRYFNQGYIRSVTPPNGPHTLMVPAQHSQQMRIALNKLSYQERMRWAHHQVRKGENLGRIARKYDVPLNSIISTNQLKSNLIHPGQELRIPISGSSYLYAKSTPKDAVARSGDKVYKIKPGDSLWGISRRYGVSITKLTRWNQISRSSLLHPGQTLVVAR